MLWLNVGQTFAAGENEVLRMTFDVAPDASPGQVDVHLTDIPAARDVSDDCGGANGVGVPGWDSVDVGRGGCVMSDRVFENDRVLPCPVCAASSGETHTFECVAERYGLDTALAWAERGVWEVA